MTQHEPITLQAGEKTYVVALGGWNEICAVEKEFDLGIFQIVQRFADGANVRLTDFHRLLVAVLTDSDGKRLTPDAAAEVIQIAGLEAGTKAAAAALQQIVARLGTTNPV